MVNRSIAIILRMGFMFLMWLSELCRGFRAELHTCGLSSELDSGAWRYQFSIGWGAAYV